jgi:hypothetical protein
MLLSLSFGELVSICCLLLSFANQSFSVLLSLAVNGGRKRGEPVNSQGGRVWHASFATT